MSGLCILSECLVYLFFRVALKFPLGCINNTDAAFLAPSTSNLAV